MSDYFEFSIPGNDFAPQSAIHTMNRADPNSSRTIPIFYVDAIEDPVASAAAGRPIYRDQEFIKILIAGDGKTEIVHKATDALKKKYREQYERWKVTSQQSASGTPLEQWPGAGVSFIKTCKAMNVYSVEALASLGDGHLTNLGMGARDMQARAKAWLAVAKDGAETERLAAENNRLQDQINLLQDQIKDMGQRFSELQSDNSPRKGR